MVFGGERIPSAEYYPLDLERVKEIKGRLGDLLHPKDGLPLGLRDSEFYRETRAFLTASIDYLWPIAKRSRPYLLYKGLPNHEAEALEEDP